MLSNNSSKLPLIANSMLQNFSGELSNENILLWHSVFGNTFTRAVELLDKAAFTLFTTFDGLRFLIQIEASSHQIYQIYSNVNYCMCPAFKYQVLINNQEITCKHVLAARLAQITQKYFKQQVSHDQFKDLLTFSCQ